jgi:hypothetical protein
MHKFWINYKGEMKRCFFYQDWTEVPYDVFLQGFQAQKALSQRQQEYNALVDELKTAKEEYEKAYFNKSRKASKMLSKSKRIRSQLDKAHESMNLAKVTALAAYTDAPMDYLTDLDIDVPTEKDGKVDLANWNITSKHIMFFENMFYLLTMQPLPDVAADRMMWQTATDEEIKAMVERYGSLSILQRLTKRGRRLKQKIRQARSSEYVVAPIWNQSSYANSKFQEMAKRVVADMEKGDFSSTQYLISMLFIEKGVEFAGEEEKDAAKALEEKQRWFKKQFDKNHELFFKQRQVMSIADVVRIRNFFLAKQPKWQKVIRMSWHQEMSGCKPLTRS